MHIASLQIQDEIRRGATASLAGQAEQEARIHAKATAPALKVAARPWLVSATALIALSLFAVEGAAASITLACGFLALFGAAITAISRKDMAPPEERRVPAGHSGA